MTTTVLEPQLLTAEEYAHLPDDGRLTELVSGRIVETNWPFTSHGYFLVRLSMMLGQFVEQHGLGRVVGGDAGLVTHRDPDTVRVPGLAYYSYQRMPRGPVPDGYWPASPELVIEIRSKNDRWKDILQTVAEYLSENVLTIGVVDPVSQRVHLFSADHELTVLNADDHLTFPDLLPGFDVIVARLFE